MPLFTCPCCGYKTLSEDGPGSFEICEICFWEHDTVESTKPDYGGGPNGVTLRKAQQNFLKFGACKLDMKKHVRKPCLMDERDEDWKPYPLNSGTK